MREIGVLEAKTTFSNLIAEVERTGEPVTVTRHGRAAVKIVPASAKGANRDRDPAEWKRLVEAVLAERDAQTPVPGFDDLSWEELKRIGRGEDRYD